MKFKTFCLAAFMVAVLLQTANAFAQAKDRLPPFAMTMSNGLYFKAADLPKGRPVLLIYFSPDCDHCHTLMNEFFKRVAEFKSVEVVLVTFKPVNELVSFEQAYQTFTYPNIKVGTEGNTNYLRLFYRLQQTPFTALYNKDGVLVASYRKQTLLNDLVKQLKKL